MASSHEVHRLHAAASHSQPSITRAPLSRTCSASPRAALPRRARAWSDEPPWRSSHFDRAPAVRSDTCTQRTRAARTRGQHITQRTAVAATPGRAPHLKLGDELGGPRLLRGKARLRCHETLLHVGNCAVQLRYAALGQLQRGAETLHLLPQCRCGGGGSSNATTANDKRRARAAETNVNRDLRRLRQPCRRQRPLPARTRHLCDRRERGWTPASPAAPAPAAAAR